MTKTPAQVIQALVDLGYSQTEIAKLSSVKQPTISRILRGVSKSPRWDYAASLAAVLEDATRPKRGRPAKKSSGAA